jgi:colanic acid biosynthesis glycosyl transferase WcaI
MYASAIGEVQGLDVVINFVLVGAGVARDRLMRAAEQRKLSNIHFVPSQPISAMGDFLASSDVQLICLRDLPLYRITLASKVQAAMSAGLPLIVSAGGDAARVVEEAKAGISVPPGSPDALATAVITAFEAAAVQRRAWGNSARTHYITQYSESVGVSAMVAALESAADSRKVAR